MSNAAELTKVFQRTFWVIKQQADGLTHEDSMLQLPFWDNCFNWVLGHIVHYRERALELLDQQPGLSEAETRPYWRESEPLREGGKALPFAQLIATLDASQQKLLDALAQSSSASFAAVYNEENQQTVGDRLAFIGWHETYHVGQLEILRQLAGASDAII
jgi:uncharacterized damage-inducible protein DinB